MCSRLSTTGVFLTLPSSRVTPVPCSHALAPAAVGGVSGSGAGPGGCAVGLPPPHQQLLSLLCHAVHLCKEVQRLHRGGSSEPSGLVMVYNKGR